MVLLHVAADPTISFSLQFAVGSQNDPPGKEGLAFLTGEMLADAATEARSLDEILNDRYLLNRTTPQQRERLLDRPEVIRAIGDDTIQSAKTQLP